MICVFLGSDCDKVFLRLPFWQVGHERPDLEELRENLVRDTGENKALLKQLEDTLLRVRLTSSGNLIWNLCISHPSIHPLQLRAYREGKDKNKKGATWLLI